MSGSFKKYGIIKDKGMSRGEYNRIFRRVNRQRIKEGKDPKHMFETVNSWNVCDYKTRWTRIENLEYYQRLLHISEQKYHKEKRSFFNK